VRLVRKQSAITDSWCDMC